MEFERKLMLVLESPRLHSRRYYRSVMLILESSCVSEEVVDCLARNSLTLKALN